MALLEILKRKKNKADSPKAPARGILKNEVSSPKKEPPVFKAASKKEEKKGERFSHIITRPRITEKASTRSGGNSYTFDVSNTANKSEIKKAIREIYGVVPVKVRTLYVKQKQRIRGGVSGETSARKKAIVFLKAGDSIEFV